MQFELLPEEKMIFHWISEYGALPKPLIYRLLCHKSKETVNKILRNLKNRGIISDIQGGYYIAPDLATKPNDTLIDSLWVLLYFRNDIDPMYNYRSEFPTQVMFLKGEFAYEIANFSEADKHLCKLLKPKEETKYIIIVPNTDLIAKLNIPEGVPCLFATVNRNGIDSEPSITFYSKNNGR